MALAGDAETTEAEAESRPRPGWATFCGALGAFDPAVLDAIAAACEVPVTPIESGGPAEVRADRPPIRWGAAGAGWLEGQRTIRSQPRDWREAATEGLAGYDGERIHSTVAGLAPIYWTSTGAATYFCTRVDPLVAVIGDRADPDPLALASMLTLGYPLGETTPFAAIRRLPPMAALEHGPGGAVVRTAPWPWQDVAPRSLDDAATELIAALDAELEPVAASGDALAPLSGGWDSRLITSRLVQLGGRPRAVTINTDKGNDREERYAARLAGYLGVPHTIVAPPPGGFEREMRWTMMAQDHMAPPHLPLARMVLALEPGQATVIDGMGGGPLIQGMIEYPGAAAAPIDYGLRRDAFWAQFIDDEAGAGMFDPELWRSMCAVTRESFDRLTDPFADDRNGFMLMSWSQRITRFIGSSPLAIIGRLGPVAMPIVSDPVARAALSYPLDQNRKGELIRGVYERVDPQLLVLPSTHHHAKGRAEASAEERTPRRRKQADAIAFYERVLAEHPLRDRFGPELRAALEAGTLRPYLRGGIRCRLFETLIGTGLWWERYRDRLSGFSLDALR